ncbi:MAG: hypothetical protein PHI28_02510 [Mangrovibacterium sp.]|nr:hypothetical protein [Mangrovibacterium sp.]
MLFLFWQRYEKGDRRRETGRKNLVVWEKATRYPAWRMAETGEWLNGWTVGWTHGWIDKRVNGYLVRWPSFRSKFSQLKAHS